MGREQIDGRIGRRALQATIVAMAAGLAAAGGLSAQFSHMVEDIHAGPPSSTLTLPFPVVLAGNQALLPADDGLNGCELWSIDSAGSGAQLVENISGSGGGVLCSTPLLSIGDRIVFVANDGFVGGELWVSDGTPAGTTLLEDQTPGAGSTFAAFPSFSRLGALAAIVVASNRLQYVDGTTATGLTEIPGTTNLQTLLGPLAQSVLYRSSAGQLWRARQSSATMVVDPNPGGADPNGIASGVYALYRTFAAFSADNGASGLEPWVTDIAGTNAHLLLDIVAGAATSTPSGFIGTDEKLFFTAADPTHGRELWIHRSTTGLTELVKDIQPGNNGSNPTQLAELDGRLYFVADDGTHGAELWTSDGTEGGTHLVKEMVAGSAGAAIQQLWVAGREIYLSRFGATDEYWQTDGTAAGTLLVERRAVRGDVAVAGERFFAHGVDFATGTEPWVFDLADQQHGPVCDRKIGFVPDDPATSFVRQLHLANPAAIRSLAVVLDLAHTYVNDLKITLTHVETGTSVVLVNRLLNPSNGECSGDDLDITFDDSAASFPASACATGDPALPRYSTFKSQEPLAAFAGESVAGTWTLEVIDNVAQDIGALDSWCLDLRTALVSDDGFESGTLGGWSAAVE
ncbi:MAG: proprotein convertase P-domain-containing protein [Thermoanaerobaculia bacterium]